MRRYLLLLAPLTLGGCDQLSRNAAREPNGGSQAPAGRFVIVHSPHVRRDTMLLDTATGVTWLWVKKANSDTEESEDVDGEGTWQRIDMADPLPEISN